MSAKKQELTILFADVVGSARLHEKLGDAEALHAVERCIKRMERAVESFKGKIATAIGDEMMALFESAEDAFNAASEMQERVADLPPVSGVKLDIRIGFHCGPVVEDRGSVAGAAVDRAARLAGLARAGQILTSEETWAKLPELLQLASRGIDQLAGKNAADGSKVYEVLWQDGGVADECAALGPAMVAEAASPMPSRLKVRHAGKEITVDAKHKCISFGRDAACDIVIRDRRGSRKHARIEFRGGRFVLIDASTNGTYVRLSGEAEFFLRKGELELTGGGRLAFASSTDSAEADVAEFEPA